MGTRSRRRLVTILDVGVLPSGGGPGPIFPETGLGVWYRADQGTLTNTAAQFVYGNSEYLSVPHNSTLALGNTTWSVGGWFWLDSYSPTATVIFGKRAAAISENDLQIYALGAGQMLANFWNGSTHPNFNSPGTAPLFSWHFIIAVYDPAVGGTLFMDGVSGALTTTLGTSFPSPIDVRLGVGNITEPYWTNGRMQNWFLFQRALDAGECNFLWNGGAGRNYDDLPGFFKTGLGAWWPLDELSGSRRDVSGNNNTLTDNNTVMANTGKVPSQAATDGAIIYTWEDSSSNNYHQSGMGVLQTPTLQVNELNGKPVARFDGVDDQMITLASIVGSALAGPQAQTVFLVQKQLSSDSFSVSYQWDSSGNSTNVLGAHLTWSDSVMYHDTGAAAAPADARLRANRPEPWTDTWHIIEMVRDGTTNSSFTIEGNPISSYIQQPTASFNTAGSSQLTLGGPKPPNTAYVFQGDIAELIMWNRTLDTAERTQVRNYLKNKWGIAQNKLMTTSVNTGYVRINSATNDRLAIN